MKNVKLLVAVALLGTASLTVTSCGKYEEGPGFTLLTKKARLTGEWDPKEYVDGDSGATQTDSDDDYITIEKDGTYKYTSGSTSMTGTWDFSSDKEKLKVSYMIGSTEYSDESTILRLTNKELWLKDPESGDISKMEKR